jgi:hypothetical protein
MDVVSHGEIRPWLAILIAKFIDMKKLVTLAALLKDRDTAWRKIKRECSVSTSTPLYTQSRIAETDNRVNLWSM